MESKAVFSWLTCFPLHAMFVFHLTWRHGFAELAWLQVKRPGNHGLFV